MKKLFNSISDLLKKSLTVLKKNQKTFAMVFFVGVIALGPFGFHVANAELCDLAIISSVCHPFAVVAADLLSIPMVFSSWLLWLAGVLLNYVLHYTVVNMAVNLDKTTGINIAWSVIRDLANISFIFVLLYAAIKTILGEGGDMKKTITGVVMAAVLLNFSLLFTKIIVDASNILTITFYSQIVKTDQGDPSQSTYSGLSDSIMQPLGLASLYDPTTSTATNLYEDLGHSIPKIAIVSIGSSIFMFTVAGIFLAMCGMFIVRYVSIMLLLILSPVWILGSWLPQMKKYSGQWFSRLSAEVTFAPVFMVMMWAVIVVINSSSFACVGAGASKNSLADMFQQVVTSINSGTVTPLSATCTTGAFGLIMNFVIAMVLVGATITIAKKTAGHSGEVAQTITSKLIAPGALLGGYAAQKIAGSKALGLDKRYINNKELNERAAKGGLTGSFARMQIAGAKAVKNTKYDAGAAIGLGKTNLFGREVKSADQAKDDEKKKADAFKAQVRKTTDTERADANKKSIEMGVVANEDAAVLQAARTAGAGGTTEQKAMVLAADKMQTTISKMNNKEIEELLEKNKDWIKNLAFAQAVNSQQLDTINKSDKFTEDEKQTFKDKRFSDTKDAIDTGVISSDIAKEIRNLTETELNLIDRSFFTKNTFVKELKASQLELVQKSKDISESEKQSLLSTRFSEINTAVGGGAAAIEAKKKEIQALTDKELAMLDRTYFDNADFIVTLKSSQIDEIQKLGDFTKEQMGRIRTTRKTHFDTTISGTPDKVKDMDIKDVGKLDSTNLTKIAVLKEFSVKKLTRLRDEIKDSDADAIRSVIVSANDPVGIASGAIPAPDPKIAELYNWLITERGIEGF